MDLLRPQAFLTEQQAKYLLRILGHNDTIKYEKLLISAPADQLKQIGNKILSISPEHTQMFEMNIVAESFELLEKYLSFYIILIATIMGTLAVLFVFLYTLGKCRDEAEMYKMLRAIGVSVTDLRIMIFLEILIRLFVSITNGILLGIVFSLGFGMQIEELLMINTPGMDLSLIMAIAAVMFVVFCATVYLATKYLTKKTVADTAKN
jgi:ABC-type antimicrobial peptide transport system permease subunit